MSACLEVVRFRVAAQHSARFVAERPLVDAFLGRFAGYLGSELAEGDPGEWVLTVRWASRDAARAAQSVTLTPPAPAPLAAWTALAQQIVSFETAELRHPPVGTPEANLAAARRFATEGLGRASMRAFDDLVDADIVVTTGLSPKAPIRGREAYKQVLAGFADAWPVIDFVIDESFAAGDKVVIRFTATAVFRKDYYGVKANNVIAPLKEVHVYTFRHGRIVENIVGAINLPYEFTMYPALKDAVLGDLKVAP
jgi:ketosteroid isomerase-like protein